MTANGVRLHPMVGHWIAAQGWTALRPMQERAIEQIVGSDRDVLIRAGTASGKTEAAFLPILSQILSGSRRPGTSCLCISPMKALINDQYDRLDSIGRFLDISVQRWHGDVSAVAKRKAREDPPEVLIITPESLEAQLMRRGYELANRFASLDVVVIDELHLFLGRQRGAQVESLLNRLRHLIGHRPRRIGLSATLGDTTEAVRFLGAGTTRPPSVVEGDAQGVQIEWDLVITPRDAADFELVAGSVADNGNSALAEEILTRAPNGTYLVFANSKSRVEALCDELSRRPSQRRVAPHHGSLSKTIREHAEELLARQAEPVVVVATSTLEVGIDVPAVKAVGQIEAPSSVATLRQRLGRSGRRGETPQLHLYQPQPEPIDERTPVVHRVRPNVLQAIACLELGLEGWVEPIAASPARWSTLVHQIISAICERGGARAPELFTLLVPGGPFAETSLDDFALLLRHLGATAVLRQEGDGTLLLGLRGERIANSASFYAVFETPVEYLVMSAGVELGSLLRTPWMRPSQPLVFAGRRWIITAVADDRRIIELSPAGGKRIPTWFGSAQPVHRRVRRRMERICRDGSQLAGLSAAATSLVDEARDWYNRLGLGSSRICRVGSDTHLFTFAGSKETETLGAMLRGRGLTATCDGIVISITPGSKRTDSAVETLLAALLVDPPVLSELSPHLGVRQLPKFHDLLPPELQQFEIEADAIDVEGAKALAADVLGMR